MPVTDLTQRPGNPAYELQKIYDDIMTINDPELLIARVRGVVEPMIGAGISKENYKRLMMTMQKILDDPRGGDTTAELRKYLTNYILKAAGLGVWNPDKPRRRGMKFEHVGDYESARIQTMATLMEDDYDCVENFNHGLRQFIESANKYGFAIIEYDLSEE